LFIGQKFTFVWGKFCYGKLFALTETPYFSQTTFPTHPHHTDLYFSNAFGTLHPKLLVQKLKCYGLDDPSLAWMSSFLTDRSQRVRIATIDEKNTHMTIKSDAVTTSMGVPQGTVLGPTSFNIYGNDMSLYFALAAITNFADDSTALVKAKTAAAVNEKTVAVNNDMIRFAKDNFLTLNAKKSQILQMHTRQSRKIVEPEISIDGTRVECVESGKILGVTFTDTMDWKKQCDIIVNKLKSTTYMFVQLKRRVTKNSLRQVYFAHAQSHILYSIIIWGGTLHIASVFTAQKRVIRAIAGVRYWIGRTPVTSCKPLFEEFDILPVCSLYILECVKFVKKFPGKFEKNSDIHNYNTRNKENLNIQPSSLQLSDQNPAVMMVKLFNHLPKAVKETRNEFCFGKLAKKL